MLSGGRRSPELCGDRSGIGKPWHGLKQAGEDDGELQKALKQTGELERRGSDPKAQSSSWRLPGPRATFGAAFW